jgi:hypothetical protein
LISRLALLSVDSKLDNAGSLRNSYKAIVHFYFHGLAPTLYAPDPASKSQMRKAGHSTQNPLMSVMGMLRQ